MNKHISTICVLCVWIAVTWCSNLNELGSPSLTGLENWGNQSLFQSDNCIFMKTAWPFWLPDRHERHANCSQPGYNGTQKKLIVANQTTMTRTARTAQKTCFLSGTYFQLKRHEWHEKLVFLCSSHDTNDTNSTNDTNGTNNLVVQLKLFWH